jgi:hypothetical protein
MDKLLPSQNPPANLEVSQVPMFVTMGFDDNGHSGLIKDQGLEGMEWATQFFSSLQNHTGNSNSATFDGESGTCSFYHSTQYICGGSDEPSELVRESWKNALDAGHGIGCHTHNHKDGSQFSVGDWKNEIDECLENLTKPFSKEVGDFGIGAKKDEIIGFRTPFLAYNDNTFIAVKDTGFSYDCSLEEGSQPNQDGTNFFWPYTLDEGAPGNLYDSENDDDIELVAPQAGLWEFPAHAVICPPDELCEKYGVEKGFRAKMKLAQPEYFSVEDGKITGLDYNCLAEFNMNKTEWLATLKYTLDLRLTGNRAPLTFGGHTDVYATGYDICPNITIAERREVIEQFFGYALTKKDVRVVSVEKILSWMKNPKAL